VKNWFITVFNQLLERQIFEEKRLKGVNRLAKITLIESFNPDWKDLYEEINI